MHRGNEAVLPFRLASQPNWEVGDCGPRQAGCQAEGDALQEGWEAEAEGVEEQHALLLPEHWQVCHLRPAGVHS